MNGRNSRAVWPPTGEAGLIVVATQVVEAGLDLNAALLVTEAAPWPSIVQRAGRCNRTGKVNGAELRWLSPVRHHPYPEDDVAASAAELAALEGELVTGEELLRRDVAVTGPAVAVLRRADLLGLFDTAPDLGGADLDVARTSAMPRIWTRSLPGNVGAELVNGRPAADGRPPYVNLPPAEWRCRARLARWQCSPSEPGLAARTGAWPLDQGHSSGTGATRRAGRGEVGR